MRILLSAVVFGVFCLTNMPSAFASPISQSTAAAVCANHGGMHGGTGCEFCSQSSKHCTFVACSNNGCIIETHIASKGTAGTAAPIKSTPEKQR